MQQFHDGRGRRLAVGDRVVRTAVDDGAPAWAGYGTVRMLGRTRVAIAWDG